MSFPSAGRLLLPIPLALVVAACSGAPAPAPATTSATPDPARPLPLPLPDVIARINGQEIRIHQILPLAKAGLDKFSVSERDARRPEAVRKALDEYLTRELLLQEALARGLAPDKRDVDWRYDQIRGQYKSEEEWARFLESQGTDAQAFKSEVRVQATVAALMEQELLESPVPEAEARAAYESNPAGFGAVDPTKPPSFEEVRGAVEASIRLSKAQAIQSALIARLRARARIRLYI